MLSAFGARAGVYAALLAQRGLTAPGSVIEGKFGIYQLYQDGEPGKLVEELGRRFDNGHFSIKIYPSCGCNHTTLDATLDLVREYDLKPDDVLSVEVTVPPYIERIVGGAYDPSGDAQVAAQFNLRYSVACALVRRKLGMAEIQESAARDPLIGAHIGKVSMKVDPALTRNRGPVVVRMRTRTHGEISRRVEDVRGSSAGLPVTAAESSAKFAECFSIGVRPLDAAAQARLTQRVRGIESVPDMSKFFEGIC
jgi:2-methylcitrate dehydratase PrpD